MEEAKKAQQVRSIYYLWQAFLIIFFFFTDSGFKEDIIQERGGCWTEALLFFGSAIIGDFLLVKIRENPGIVSKEVPPPEQIIELIDELDRKSSTRGKVSGKRSSRSSPTKSLRQESMRIDHIAEEIRKASQQRMRYSQMESQEYTQNGYDTNIRDNISTKDKEEKSPRELRDLSNPLLEPDLPELQRTYSLEENNHDLIYINPEEVHEDQPETGVKAIPAKHFCDKCRNVQEYRTRHCHLCQVCVSKFDHHCFWSGCCIGEQNHRIYWTMLFFMAIQHYLSLRYLWSSFGSKIISHQAPLISVAVFMFIVELLLFLFAFLLTLYHSYLLSTNQTTWEHTKADTINYMQVYPPKYFPFDRGVFNNLKMCILPGPSPHIYDLPDIHEAWMSPRGPTLLNNPLINLCC